MERIAVGVFRINAVCGKAAAQTVGAVVHGGDRADDFGTIRLAAILVEDARDRTSRGDMVLAFF